MNVFACCEAVLDSSLLRGAEKRAHPRARQDGNIHRRKAVQKSFGCEDRVCQSSAQHSIQKERRTDRHDLATRLICKRLKIRKLKWPAYSPDPNCLENVLSLLLDRRAANGELLPKNKQESFQMRKTCWERLNNDTVKKTYLSFEARLHKVRLVRGKSNFCCRSKA